MRSRGVSMLELMIALAIMTLTVMAVGTIIANVPGIVSDARHAAGALEEARESLYQPEYAAGGMGSTTDSSAPLEDEGFSLLIRSASWTSTHGSIRAESLSSIKRTSSTTETCDPFTSGNWTRPIVTASFSVGDDTISSLALLPGTLAIGFGSTTQADDPSLLLYSLQDGTPPAGLAAFDNAAASRVGIGALAAEGAYVFAGNSFGSASSSTCADGTSCSQLTSYRIRGNAVTVASRLTLSTSSPPYAIESDGASSPITALAQYHGFLYLGLQKTAEGDEFNIIDMRDPERPRWVAGYPIGRTVNGISVRGSYAYVSTDDPMRELMVFDVSDPSDPALSAQWDAPGSSTFGYGSESTAYGNLIRFGRTYTANGPEFEMLRLGSTSDITETWAIDSGTPADPESVRALLTQDRLTFLLLTHRLDIVDTHVPGRAPVIGSYPLPDGSNGVALACRNNQLYLGRMTSGGTGIIDILQGS